MSQALEGDFTGFIFEDDKKQAPIPESESVMDTTKVEPQSRNIQVESQSKFDWLCNKKVMMSDFEATLDGLVGDGQSIIQEFVDWESSGPTYDFNELRKALCGEAKLSFNADSMYLFGLAYTGRDSKKIWTSRTMELVGIEYQSHPDNLDSLYLEQSQIISFVLNHPGWLRKDGYGTFFLTKEAREFFVAYAVFTAGRLGVYIRRFDRALVWHARRFNRIVFHASGF